MDGVQRAFKPLTSTLSVYYGLIKVTGRISILPHQTLSVNKLQGFFHSQICALTFKDVNDKKSKVLLRASTCHLLWCRLDQEEQRRAVEIEVCLKSHNICAPSRSKGITEMKEKQSVYPPPFLLFCSATLSTERRGLLQTGNTTKHDFHIIHSKIKMGRNHIICTENQVCWSAPQCYIIEMAKQKETCVLR